MRQLGTTETALAAARHSSFVFRRITLIVNLIVVVSALAGCANQNVAADQTLAKQEAALRSRSFWASFTNVAANRKISRSSSELNLASPEHTGSLSAASMPNSADATVQPALTTEIDVPSRAPDPRTMQALTCRELMLKEHPKVGFGIHGNAVAQRDHFDSCMRRTSDRRQASE